ncbi:MAG: hypothetical protein WDO70_06300 [Alphaproteobacteria bacterium]
MTDTQESGNNTAPSRLPPAMVEDEPRQARGADGLARVLACIALVLAAGTLAWPQLQPPPPDAPPVIAAPPVDVSALKARQKEVAQELDLLKQDVAAIAQAQAQAPAPEPPAVAQDQASAAQLKAALAQIAALRADLAELQQSVGSASTVHQEIARLKGELAEAKESLSSMSGSVQKITDTTHETAAAESATRAQIIAYMQLRERAGTAAPFATELQALSDVARSSPELTKEFSKLENPSQGGVATLPMLLSRFNVMSGSALQAAELAAATTWWERMSAHMKEVVMVRKLNDDGSGGSPARMVHDAAAALQRGDLPKAISRVEAMPEPAQKQLQEWLGDARARRELDVAMARIGALLGQHIAHDDDKEQAAP